MLWRCVLCVVKSPTVCGECKEHHCADCIDAHTCGANTVCQAHEKRHALMLNVAISPYAVCSVSVGTVRGLLWSTWAASLGRVKPGSESG